MGTRMAPCYANIFMAELEDNFLSGYPYKPLAYYRYIDDIFIIWPHGLDLLDNFINNTVKSFSLNFETNKFGINKDISFLSKYDAFKH